MLQEWNACKPVRDVPGLNSARSKNDLSAKSREVLRSLIHGGPRRTSSLSAENAEGRGENPSLIREVTRGAEKNIEAVSDFLRMAVQPFAERPHFVLKSRRSDKCQQLGLRAVFALYLQVEPKGLGCGLCRGDLGASLLTDKKRFRTNILSDSRYCQVTKGICSHQGFILPADLAGVTV